MDLGAVEPFEAGGRTERVGELSEVAGSGLEAVEAVLDVGAGTSFRGDLSFDPRDGPAGLFGVSLGGVTVAGTGVAGVVVGSPHDWLQLVA
jgi:hypothetical protein